MKAASWVVRNKETGEVLFETFDQRKVDALNTAKYEAVPILEYLVSLNKRLQSELTELRTTAANQAETIERQQKLLACLAACAEFPEGGEFFADHLYQPLCDLLESYMQYYDHAWVKSQCKEKGNG